jgi:hypothetical protein
MAETAKKASPSYTFHTQPFKRSIWATVGLSARSRRFARSRAFFQSRMLARAAPDNNFKPQIRQSSFRGYRCEKTRSSGLQ